MFTRSQAKKQQEVQLQEPQLQESQESQQQQEELLKAVECIKSYMNDIDNIKTNHSIWNYQMAKIKLINELYAYMLTNETKQNLFVPSFAKMSRFLTILLNRTQHLKCELLNIIKKEMIQEYRDKQNELLSKLNDLDEYLQENSVSK